MRGDREAMRLDAFIMPGGAFLKRSLDQAMRHNAFEWRDSAFVCAPMRRPMAT
jgi:hypothetical protein